MATTLKNAKQQAATAAKEERARDAALAMQEYEAEKLAHSVWGKKLKVTNARRGRIRKRSHRSCEGVTSSTASPLSWKTRNRDCAFGRFCCKSRRGAACE